jgi:CheY-like chemotaxis protein
MHLPGLDPHPRFDFFEPGDKTALVCLDVGELQRLAIEQLDELGYKIHTGMFMDDSVLKLRAHAYDVVVVSEFFGGCTLANHPILAEAAAVPPQRRQQVFVLVGESLSTNDEMQAFAHNADVVVSLRDLRNLKPVMRRAVARAEEFFAPLREALAATR